MILGCTILQDLEPISEIEILIQAVHEKVQSQSVGRNKEQKRNKGRKN